MKSKPANTSAPAKIRVLCVDDSRDITSILSQCIQREPDMESAGALHAADDLLERVCEQRPHVVLLDMTMPGKDPLAVLAQLTAAGDGDHPVSVIVFSGHDDDDVTDSAEKAGACGFLSKQADVSVILGAIRAAARWRRGTDPFMVWL